MTMTTTISCASSGAPRGSASGGSYDDLGALFHDWRAFEEPPLREGAPDYTAAAFARRHDELKGYQARLAAIDATSWSIAQRVDYEIVDTVEGLSGDESGEVEFRAYYVQSRRSGRSAPADAGGTLHERSRFAVRARRWFYVDGELFR